MKLNKKRTIYVGFAFFLILAFWQAYDTIVPLILTNKFGMSQFWSGVIMAADNVLALVLLPLFGALSDRHKGRSGRRTPFIRTGTLAAVVLLVALSLIDGAQLKKIQAVSTVDDPAALTLIYDTQLDKSLITPQEEDFTLREKFPNRDTFTSITSTTDGEVNEDYVNYVVPARQAYVHEVTTRSPGTLVLFVGVLLMLLLAMSVFRSPAVALMPDVTLKPLRSKANAVINLMGYIGGIVVLGLGIVFSTGSAKNAMMSYVGFFGAVAALMLIALGIFLWKVREPQWVAEMQAESLRLQLTDQEEASGEKRKLTRGEKWSMTFLLASVVLWYFGYNAVISKFSVYASSILQKDFNATLTLANAAAILSFVPVGMVSSRVGRKKAILAGVAMLAVSFTVGATADANTPGVLMNAMFILAGIAWATINVNSFPMVVEMCGQSDVGQYTGYYYTASMAAQTLTPMLSGYLMEQKGMTVLFPYAAIFVAGAFVTMLFVKHGDAKVQRKKGLEAFDIED